MNTGGWRPGSLGYEAELTAIETETASIDLGLRPDGKIDLVIVNDGAEMTLAGLAPADLATLAVIIAAATSPDVLGELPKP